jgi:hypothetical protein
VIDRAVQLARATSSSTSAAVLVAFNLIPLAGVLWWGWNVATLLILYWVENGIVGLSNVPKILLAEASPTIGPLTIRLSGGVQAASQVATAAFFVFHYGLFWFVHGVFVWTLPLFFAARTEPFDPLVGEIGPIGPIGLQVGSAGPNLSAVTYGAIGLAISHGVSFVINYLGRQEYRWISPQAQAMAPYGRLLILHVTIIVGAIVSLAVGSPVGAVLVLVLLKTAVDLAFHRREHSRIAAGPAPG